MAHANKHQRWSHRARTRMRRSCGMNGIVRQISTSAPMEKNANANARQMGRNIAAAEPRSVAVPGLGSLEVLDQPGSWPPAVAAIEGKNFCAENGLTLVGRIVGAILTKKPNGTGLNLSNAAARALIQDKEYSLSNEAEEQDEEKCSRRRSHH